MSVVSDLFEVSIEHSYMGYELSYDNQNAGFKKIFVISNCEHYYIDKQKTKKYKKSLKKFNK